ncbi:MAG: hypothetical protein HYX40_06365 [Sphingobacteriales bacterium]|nr:hypothetical protein [Sphingobacteriales bacterium]
MELVLVRTYYSKGTNGDIFLHGDRVCSTIELPWKDNHPQVSCIPEGKYSLQKRYSLKFKAHLQLTPVSGRQWILVHAANDALKELKGCIAPVSFLTGEGRGTESRKALARLLALVNSLLKERKPVFLIIQSKHNEHSYQTNE